MTAVDDDGADWDKVVQRGGEAPLLLDELHHRVSNEVASAIAAMRLAQNAGLRGPRLHLFDQAIQRLEGFGKVHGILAARPAATVDVDAQLHGLCRGLVSGRGELDGGKVWLAAQGCVLPGGSGCRLMLVAAELMANAFRHAIAGREGNLWVTVHRTERDAVLVVTDDGPGFEGAARTRGTGLGRSIVSELVRMGGGRLETSSDENGTTVKVLLPLDCPSPIGWVVRETEA